MPIVSKILAAYRADRLPVVVMIDRIDTTIAHLIRQLGKLDVSALTRQVLLDYTAQRVNDGVKPQTARRELTTLRAALRMLWKDGKLKRVPYIPLPPPGPRRERVLSTDEIRALMSATAPMPRCHAFLRLLVATCGRAAAVCELKWEKVDLELLQIDLRSTHARAARMKGRAVVPITSELKAFLRAYRDTPITARGSGRQAKPGQRVVGVSVSTARAQLHKAARAAGVKGVTPHVIRHSVATHMLRSDVPLVIVSHMLGHASVSITADIYGHLVTEDMILAAQAISRWAG